MINVKLWGNHIGRLWHDKGRGYVFRYNNDWIDGGAEVSPIHMPLSRRDFVFRGLNPETYYGLPGLIADALPDRFGNAVINGWMASKGITSARITPLERLAYIGSRGMGALEFEPEDSLTGELKGYAAPLVMRELVESARKGLRGGMLSIRDQLVQVGASAGGARAKAVIGYNRATRDIVSGQFDIPEGYVHALIKMDGVDGKPGIYGRREAAYLAMAQESGIKVPYFELFTDDERQHLIVERFDRDGNEKLHMQSLCGLAHVDFNQRLVTDYAVLMRTMRMIGLGWEDIEESFRRMVFNVLVVNCDDHTKNISFLMDQSGKWSLSPAYDLSYAWSDSPEKWTHGHQMTINGKSLDINMDDVVEVGRIAGMSRNEVSVIVDKVALAICAWPEIAARYRVDEVSVQVIQDAHVRAMQSMGLVYPSCNLSARFQ